MSTVKALGYAVVGATDLDEWVRFASDLLGLQVAHRDDDRLLLRMDEYVYRLDVRRSEQVGVLALGWDVGTPEALQDLTKRLQTAGYDVEHPGEELAAEREVMELVRFRDPEDKLDFELYWGLRNSLERFISPTGAQFVTRGLGFGHAFQAVRDQAPFNKLFRELLGFRLSDHVDMTGGVVATFLHCNARHHSYAYADLAHRKPGIGHLMFEVDDIDVLGRAWDKVQEGAAPILSTLGKHTNDKMISFYVKGPSGFGIEYGVDGITIDDDDAWLPTRYQAAHYWGHHRPTS